MSEKFIEDGQERKFDQKQRTEIDDIKEIINRTIIDFHNYEFPKYIGNYKKYLGFVGDRLGSIDAWQSNVDYPLVASVVDTMFGNIFDFGYEFGINEPALKKLCTQSFDFRSIGKRVFKEVAKEILICGKGYVKDYLLKEETSEEFFGKTIEQKIKKPSMYYLSIFDVMYDRSKGLTDSPYKVIRTFSTGDAIKRKVLPLILANEPDETKHKMVSAQFDRILKAYKDRVGMRFSMYDYNPVKSLTATTQFYNSDSEISYALPYAKDIEAIRGGYKIDGTMSGNNEIRNNYFLNDKQSTFEVIEYSSAERKVIFINGNLIYIGDRKYNLGEIREANFSLVPGTGNANGVADNLGGLQDINNMLWNAFLDNIKLNMGPMFKVSGNIPIGKNGTLDFKKFRAFRSNGSSDIVKIQLGVTDFAPINFMQVVQSFAEQRSGVNNYIMGGAGSIERVAGGIDMKFNQYKSKLTPITDSIDQMMGNIARSWVLMYFKFFTKAELMELGLDIQEVYEEDEKGKSKFVGFTVNGMDLKTIIDERNITFTYNSLSKLTKENSRASIKESLMALLQYAGPKINLDEIAKVLTGADFDPENITIKQKPSKSGFQNSQDFKGSEAGALPSAGSVPVDNSTGAYDQASQYQQGGQEGQGGSYDNYSNNYNPNKYDQAYGQSNQYGSQNAGPGQAPEDDEALLAQLGSIA